MDLVGTGNFFSNGILAKGWRGTVELRSGGVKKEFCGFMKNALANSLEGNIL